MIKGFLSVILIVFCSLFELCAIEHDQVELSFQHANKSIIEHDYEGALTQYLLCLELNESANLHHNIGVACYLKGEVGLAILHLEKASRLSLANASTHEVLSLIRRSEGIANPNYSMIHQVSRLFPEWFWFAFVFFGFWGVVIFGIYCFLLIRRISIYRDLAVIFLIILLVGLTVCFGLNEDAGFGVLVDSENPLQIVPTKDGESFMTLSAGEMAKLIKRNNDFVFIETSSKVRGWVSQESFKLIR